MAERVPNVKPSVVLDDPAFAIPRPWYLPNGLVVTRIDKYSGYPDRVDVLEVVEPDQEEVDVDDVEDPPDPPLISDIDEQGPAEFTAAMDKITSWNTLDLVLESAPNLHIASIGEQVPGDLPTEVDGTLTVPSATAVDFDDTYSDSGRVAVPVVPNIAITTFTGTVPSFTVTRSATNLSWVYAEYTSALLDTLKTKANALRTATGLNISTVGAIARDKQIWESPSYFLKARGLSGLQTRETTEYTRFKDNITRLIDILEYDNIDTNTKLYIQFRQDIENLDRGLYDRKKAGELLFAKAYAENGFNNYRTLIESYNQLLKAFRLESLVFEDTLNYERAKLEDYRQKVSGYLKAGQVDETLFNNYKAQISIVNSTVRAFETALAVDEAIANITLLKAELTRLNTESFVMRTRAAVESEDIKVFYQETEVLKQDLIDVDIAYAVAALEQQASALERLIMISQESIDDKNYESDKTVANTVSTVEAQKAEHWVAIARDKLSHEQNRALEAQANELRRTSRADSEGDKLDLTLQTNIDIANDRSEKNLGIAYAGSRIEFENRMSALEIIEAAKVEAADILRQAEPFLELEHKIKDETT